MSTGTPKGPLQGVKVIDLTTVMLGPFCTQILGEMGADVIKIETPDGDVNRWTGAARSPGMSQPDFRFSARVAWSQIATFKNTSSRVVTDIP